MSASQFIRIALLLAAIFAAGVFTGRWTTRSHPQTVYTVPLRPGTPKAILVRLTEEVGLDEAQQSKARPILEEYVSKMTQTPVGSPERLEHVRQCTAQLRELMRPDQYERFDRQLAGVARFFQRQVQQTNVQPLAPR